MAIEFTCSSEHLLTMPDHYAGKLVECPLCGERLPVPLPEELALVRASAPIPAAFEAPKAVNLPDEHDAVGHDLLGMPVTSGEERVALRTARIGIVIHRAKVLVLIFGLILWVIASGFIFVYNLEPVIREQAERNMRQPQAERGFPRRPLFGRQRPARQQRPMAMPPLDQDLQKKFDELSQRSLQQAELLLNAHSAIIALLGLIGSWYLLAVPRSSHAGGLIAFSLIMDLVHLAASGVNQYFFREQNLLLSFLALSSLALCYILLMLFLSRFALYLGQPEVSSHATHHLRMWSRLLSATILLPLAMLFLTRLNPVVAAVALVLGLVLLLVLWITWVLRYVSLLSDIRSAIDFRLGWSPRTAEARLAERRNDTAVLN